MSIWSSELKELEKLYASFKGALPDLEKELEHLIKTDDPVVVLLYSRRSLELIVNELCETELNRPRKTEPLKGIIDKLNSENKVPEHIIASMQGLNSLSNFGAHPKEFEMRQVKPVINNLITIIEWYLIYKNARHESNVNQLVKGALEGSNKNDYLLFGNRKTLFISLGIIITCIIIVVFFNNLDLFQKDKFSEIKEADGKISVTVLPFRNLTRDTLLNFWQEGAQNLLINSLSNSKELSVLDFQTMNDVLTHKGYTNYASITPGIGRDIASTLKTSTFITGTLMKSGELIRISAQLRNTQTNEIYKTFDVDLKTENDFFKITDSLSRLLKDYLEIKVLEQDIDYEKREFSTTTSSEAYRYFIEGFKFGNAGKYELSIQSLTRAIEIDSSFTNAFNLLAILYSMTGQHKEAKYYLQKAYTCRSKIPINEKLFLDVTKALFEKDIQKCLLLEEQLVEFNPKSAWWWRSLGTEYARVEKYDKSAECWEKAYELYKQTGMKLPMIWFYASYGYSLHKTGNHVREMEILEEGLKIENDNADIIYQKTLCFFLQRDTTQGYQYLDKLSLIRDGQGWNKSDILNEQANIFDESGFLDKAGVLYRKALQLDSENLQFIYSYAHYLLKNDINLNKGIELVNQALKTNPEDGDILYLKGLIYSKKGKLQEASEILKKSWELRSGYSHEHYLLLQEVEQALNQKKCQSGHPK